MRVALATAVCLALMTVACQGGSSAPSPSSSLAVTDLSSGKLPTPTPPAAPPTPSDKPTTPGPTPQPTPIELSPTDTPLAATPTAAPTTTALPTSTSNAS